MSSVPVTVLIVDDNAVVCEALAVFLGHEPGVAVWGTAGSGADALYQLDHAEAHPGAPDTLLVDVHMPNMSGVELVAEVAARHPDVSCLMHSVHPPSTYAEQARAAGAKGYVEKVWPDRIAEAIRRVPSSAWVAVPAGR